MRTVFQICSVPRHMIIVAVGLLAVICQVALWGHHARGDEPMDLFGTEPPAAVSRESSAESRGPEVAVECLDLFGEGRESRVESRGPAAARAPAPALPVDLFGIEVPNGVERGAEGPGLRGKGQSQEGTPVDTRPLAILWSPDWCTVCQANARVVGEGDHRLRVRVEHGNDRDFPGEVQAFANGVFPQGTSLAGQQRGWPVWQLQREDGSWCFAYHARSIDDLMRIRKLKRGDPIPEPTIQLSLRYRAHHAASQLMRLANTVP